MEWLWMILGWIVFGAVIGAIARLLVPGEQPIGCLMTILLGVAGSFVGGFLASLIFDLELTIRSTGNWIGAIIGAIIVLLIWIQFTKKKKG